MPDKTSEEFLKDSLIFRMSLGSKELFHSNVWAWLIEKDINFAKVFGLDEETISHFQVVKREENNRDLVLYFKDERNGEYHITIENKIKSVPTPEQLKDYSKDIGKNHFKWGILTGLRENVIDFGKHGLDEKWTYVDYPTIATGIRDVLANSSFESKEKYESQIKEYCDVLDAISDVLEKALNANPTRLDYGCESLLKDLKLDDVFKKLKGSQFLARIRQEEHYLQSICPAGFRLVIDQSFSHKNVCLDVRFTNERENEKKGKSPHELMGVQLQGSQFRLAAERNIRLDPTYKTDEELFQHYLGLKWFDSSFKPGKQRFVHCLETSMKPRGEKYFDSFQTDAYCFIYQYFDIQANWTYDDIVEKIKAFMKEAAEILSRGE